MSETYNLSQMAPLPPISGVSLGKTIGHGGFALVKCGKIHSGRPPFVAVKLIHLQFAAEKGITINNIAKEAMIQKTLNHQNIIKLLDFAYDRNWSWIALELAEGGELFDKIEPDIGVDLDVAHFYFTQLINAVSYMHSIGVAHRDIKPENLVLDRQGNLKLTDFGLAEVFKKKSGPKRRLHKTCGSPPYAAPDILQDTYDAPAIDVWSCGIVLFVLLTGKIAWELPHLDDPDYSYYVAHRGEILTSPWNKLDLGALGLIRKILVPNVDDRITIEQIKENKWFQKDRGLLDEKGMCKNSHKLNAKLLVNLYINMSDGEFEKVTEYSATQKSNNRRRLETQPEKYIIDDLDVGIGKIFSDVYSASQQVYTERTKRQKLRNNKNLKHQRELELIAMDPAMFQFYRDENDISKEMRSRVIEQEIAQKTDQIRKHPELYADSLTRFFSFASLEDIVVLLTESMAQLNVVDAEQDDQCQKITQKIKENDGYQGVVRFQLNFRDDYKCALAGEIVLSKVADNLEARKIDFIRQVGDPMEWRRFFKRITILCRDIVYFPER